MRARRRRSACDSAGELEVDLGILRRNAQGALETGEAALDIAGRRATPRLGEQPIDSGGLRHPDGVGGAVTAGVAPAASSRVLASGASVRRAGPVAQALSRTST
jgi:hypothetical protein